MMWLSFTVISMSSHTQPQKVQVESSMTVTDGSTGLVIGDLRAGAADSTFLAGVLDYFLQNEALLLAFAASEELAPETIVRARQRLPGALND